MSHLLLIETSGNQAYIFATNKLREEIGASELTYRAGALWLREALGVDNRGDTPRDWRAFLKESGGRVAGGCEVVIATSGKALVLCESREQAQEIVQRVTLRAAREAPGLQVAGAIVPCTADRKDRVAMAQAVRGVHERFNTNRQTLGVQALRFPLLPLGQTCATSGLAASHVDRDGQTLFAECAAKARAAPEWFRRIQKLLKAHGKAPSAAQGRERPQAPGQDLRFAYGIDDLERAFGASFVGILHADGNGLGQIVLAFDQWLDGSEDYFDTLRKFSLELEEATEAAFVAACTAVQAHLPGRTLPLVPLVLGGDDLTAAIAGDVALPFTVRFLQAFLEETSKRETLARIARKALGAPRLGISAGLALVKAHFPFALAYGLAEALMQSAKEIKKRIAGPNGPWPAASFDAHVLFDASGADLETIRARRRGANGERLWGGPWLLDGPLPETLAENERRWCAAHAFSRLTDAMAAVMAEDDEGRRRLPASQMHALREVLSGPRGQAESFFALLKGRYGTLTRAVGGEALFYDDGEDSRTLLLDAMTLASFWPGSANVERLAEVA